MIVRIMTEGQYRLPDSALSDLNDLDNKLVEVTARGDAAEFHRLLVQMHDYVKRNGQAVPADELVGSDVILPPRTLPSTRPATPS